MEILAIGVKGVATPDTVLFRVKHACLLINKVLVLTLFDA